jgi:hypothetical protein
VEVVIVAMIGLVWLDGAPALGMEYGPGDAPLCCSLCGVCVTLIVEAQRGDNTLGWLMEPCHCVLDSTHFDMNVSEVEQGRVTVVFSTKETGDTEHDSGGDDPGDPPDSDDHLDRESSGKPATAPRKRAAKGPVRQRKRS